MDDVAGNYISTERIQAILDYQSLIQYVERGLGHFSKRGEVGVVQPPRTVVHVNKSDGFFGCMPVYSEIDNILVTKLVTFFPNNKDIPTHHAVIIVFDTETGVPKAILDGAVITERRTAAASVVATKHLVNGNPKILAVLGSGVQARSHYRALSEVFTFDQVRIWNHRFEGAQRLATEIGEKCLACSSVQEAVLGADVIVTVTSSKVPILKAEWVKPGAHINAVGACRPDWSEIDPELMRSAVVYVDSYEGAERESGDVLLAQDKVFFGTKEGYRNKVTVFKSL
ncbi:unnamed protein product, partial [Candidula unifasciata]